MALERLLPQGRGKSPRSQAPPPQQSMRWRRCAGRASSAIQIPARICWWRRGHWSAPPWRTSSLARSREGARLRDLIEQRCAGLVTLVAQVRTRLPEVRARIRARLDERLAELKAEVDQERLEQELALLLQRLDVDEELDRLGAHIEEIRRIIAGSEPAGRRLDFLMQELNREANTLSSKSQDLETTRAGVDMKVLIEQLREQVQNVE
jgi:uncharacterized protein (TIGR00255 family)